MSQAITYRFFDYGKIENFWRYGDIKYLDQVILYNET